MNLVDSSAWLEYFADGPNASFFAPPIEKSSELVVPTVVLYEVYKRIAQQRNDRAALDAMSVLQHGRIVDLTASLALAAAQTGCEKKLPMTDSIILATARAENAIIWTQDADFKDMDRVRFRARKA